MAVRIFEKQIRFTRAKLVLVQDLSAGFLHSFDSGIDFFWIEQPETKMRDTAGFACSWGAFIENNNVACSGRLCLDPSVLIVNLHHTENFPVKCERSFRVFHRQSEVSETVCLDH